MKRNRRLTCAWGLNAGGMSRESKLTLLSKYVHTSAFREFPHPPPSEGRKHGGAGERGRVWGRRRFGPERCNGVIAPLGLRRSGIPGTTRGAIHARIYCMSRRRQIPCQGVVGNVLFERMHIAARQGKRWVYTIVAAGVAESRRLCLSACRACTTNTKSCQIQGMEV
jgi:hypothetical protein